MDDNIFIDIIDDDEPSIEVVASDDEGIDLIVEIGSEGMSAADFAALLATKEDELGAPSSDDQILSSKIDKTRSWIDQYSHPTQAAISETCLPGELISGVVVNTSGHVTSVSKNSVYGVFVDTTIDWTGIDFDDNGKSLTTITSDGLFSFDDNYIYMNMKDEVGGDAAVNYWCIASTRVTFASVSGPGSFPFP